MNELVQYLNELRAELQEQYTTYDQEILNTTIPTLINDAYDTVGSSFEKTIDELDELIDNIENGVYDRGLDDLDGDE
jgi:glutathionyl-hydroquinone reductase